MTDASLAAAKSRKELMHNLRRVGGFFLLFMVLVHASLHWISMDLMDSILVGVPIALESKISCAVIRMNMILLVSGLALIPSFFLAGVFVTRFTRRHFDAIEQRDQQKSRFISMVSHELRTPLNAIKGYVDLLARDSKNGQSKDQAEYIGEIRHGVVHLSEIVKDLLDLSKIEAGKIDLQKEELVLAAVLEETFHKIAPLATERGLAFEASGSPKTQILGDKTRIMQILLNLLANAIKFSPRDGRIKVLWSVRGSETRITVTDQGGGIDEKDQERLFEEFEQAHSAGAVMDEGSGLGLAISKKLVELHGGRIGVQSVEGIGTSFHFTIPLPPAAPAANRLAELDRAKVAASSN